MENIPIDEFFDSNDGFDDIILPAEANITPESSITNNTISTGTNYRQEEAIKDDLASAFNDNNDDMFADIQWESETQITSSLNQIAARNHCERRAFDVDLDDSFVMLLRDGNDCNDDDYVWGSAAKNARLSQNGPPSKKTKVNSSESKNHRHYTWDTDGRNNAESSVDVKCSGCHQPAKE